MAPFHLTAATSARVLAPLAPLAPHGVGEVAMGAVILWERWSAMPWVYAAAARKQMEKRDPAGTGCAGYASGNGKWRGVRTETLEEVMMFPSSAAGIPGGGAFSEGEVPIISSSTGGVVNVALWYRATCDSSSRVSVSATRRGALTDCCTFPPDLSV